MFSVQNPQFLSPLQNPWMAQVIKFEEEKNLTVFCTKCMQGMQLRQSGGTTRNDPVIVSYAKR